MHPPVDLEALTAQRAWIARLARSLARDESAADDLVQETWLTALRSARGGVLASRSWLSGVARNLARSQRRRERRSAERERRAARPEAVPSAAQLVEEVSVQREVSQAVLALPEPLREAILLRFYRGLALREVAERQGVPLSTVHDRIGRGLESLRKDLDRAHGGSRRAWMLALLPAAETTGAASAPVLGALAVSTSLKLAAVALVAAGGALGIWMTVSGPAAAPSPAPGTANADGRPAVDLTAVALDAQRYAPAPAGAREEVVPRPTEPEPAAAAVRSTVVRGRVIDLEGRAVADVAVRFETERPGDEERPEHGARTDRTGSFEIDSGGGWGPIEVSEAGWSTLVPGRAHSGRQHVQDVEETVVVAARRRPIAGWVVERDGTPVEAASLRVEIKDAVYRRMGMERPAWRDTRGWEDTSDEDGRFELPAVAGGAGLLLVAERGGFRDLRLALEDLPPGDARLVLEREEREGRIWGTVVDEHGDPVEGAHVSAGGQSTRSDDRGTFVLDARAQELPEGHPHLPEVGRVLRAVQAGHLPAAIPLAELPEPPVELRLGPEARELVGRVVDPRGAPVAGAVVWIRDLTPFGQVVVESGEARFSTDVSQEDLMRGGYFERGERTDADGAFRLTGLLERTYLVEAYSPRTLASSGPLEARAGQAGVEIVIDEGGGPQRVAGRVLGLDGEPIAKAGVLPRRRFPGEGEGDAPPAPRTVTPITDAAGAFEIDALVVEGTSLDVHAQGFRGEVVELEHAADVGDLEVRLARVCRMQIDALLEPDGARAFRVLDEAGDALELLLSRGNVVVTGEDLPLDGEERSSVVQTDERARWLVLLLNGEEVRRVPLRLRPDELNVVRP